MLNRAYAMLEVRALQEDQRVFEGWATTPTPDRLGDVIDPMGAKFKNPLVLLHQHDSTQPIGTVRFQKATPEGIAFTASIPRIAEAGPLQDRVNTAWGEIKAGLVRAVSIGFRVLQDGVQLAQDGAGLIFSAIEIVELSAVSVPANAEATITNIRSFDQGPAASGAAPTVKTNLPGVSGSLKPQARKGAAMPRTIAEQIDDFTKAKAAKVARQQALMAASGDSGETFDAAEAEEFDLLAAEIKSIDAHLERLAFMERAQAATATPVIRAAGAQTAEPAAPVVTGRAEPVVRAAERCEPGIRMARVAKAIVLGRLSMRDPMVIAQERYGGSDPGVVEVVRAAISGGTTTDATWAGPLVGYAGEIIGDFVAFLRPMTILGKFGTGSIPSLRMVPFRTALLGQTSGGAGYWVGEGKAKPVTKFDFERQYLNPLKVAGITVVTEELIRDASIAADAFVRDALVAALAARMDIDFVDPAKVAVAGISPASITNGVVPIPSVGNDAASVRQDIKAMYSAYTAAYNSLANGVWIMPADLAAALGMMVNLLGQPEFPGLDRSGGTLVGFPVIPSDYVKQAAPNTVILANAKEIYLGDEGGFAVDISREASLEMTDTPIGSVAPPPPPAPAEPPLLVSLWQADAVGLRAERTINWLKRRPQAVVVLGTVHWGDP
jgi:HK97 family phage prohead protease